MRPEIATILARVYCCAMTFLLNGRDFGQAFKTENLRRCATGWERVWVPENPYSVGVSRAFQTDPASGCAQPNSVALLRIVLLYVFGNGEYAGFAFELNFTGRVCRELDLPGFCAKPSHHIPDRCALIQPG